MPAMLDSIEPSFLSTWLNSVSPGRIFGLVIGFFWLTYLWMTYLSWRQYRLMQRSEVMPEAARAVTDPATYAKSRAYGVDRARFSLVRDLWSQVLFTFVLAAGFLPWLWATSGRHLAAATGWQADSELAQSLLFVVYSSLLSFVVNLPWSVYSTFVVEARHGFNKQTPAFFAKDKAKGLAVGMAIGLPVIAALLILIDWGGRYFYVYAWLMASAVTFAMIWIYPTFIAPLFDRYEPLREGRLKQRIEELAARLRFPLTQLLVVEGSRRSAHSNAYLFGLWRSKRIVLFDTLIEGYRISEKPEGEKADEKAKKAEEEAEKADKKTGDSAEEKPEKKDEADAEEKAEEKAKETKAQGCNEDEILAVLGHELGHWSLSHNLYNIVIMEANMLLMFFAFGQFVHCRSVFAAFGFEQPAPLLIRLLFVMEYLLSPYNELLTFAMTWLTRRFEFQADAFSVGLGFGQRLCTALTKLQVDNLSFPLADPLYSAFCHSHPPLLQRLAAIELSEEAKSKKSR